MMQLFIPASKPERSESASAFYQWAEENSKEQPLKFYYAQILSATHNLLSESHESALPLLLKARNGCEERGDKDGVAMIALFLGLAYRTMGNFDLALKRFWRHLPISSRRDVIRFCSQEVAIAWPM